MIARRNPVLTASYPHIEARNPANNRIAHIPSLKVTLNTWVETKYSGVKKYAASDWRSPELENTK
jgi:hypothetical protein